MKKHVVSINYDNLLADSPEQAVSILGLQYLKKEYIGGKYIYTPDESVEKIVTLVDEENIRSITKEERENKELEQAKSSAQWAKKESEDLKKQVEELKCQLAGIKALKEEEKGEEENV